MTNRRQFLQAGAILPLSTSAMVQSTGALAQGTGAVAQSTGALAQSTGATAQGAGTTAQSKNASVHTKRPPASPQNPFTLGVASGYPHAHGMVLWTRLAPQPDAPHGGLPDSPIAVDVLIAKDPAFRSVVHRRRIWAMPQWAHSIHHEPNDLEPGQWYWYRFETQGHTSTVGRTRTTPSGRPVHETLRVGAVCCQHYEHGFFNAYRALVDDEPDLIVHLGDYIYENHGGRNAVRVLDGPAPITLADYRIHHARYKLDVDLQRAHAACPWLMTWDDHEVVDGYAANRSSDWREPAWFDARRAAAYRAYYEHMPLPRFMLPVGAQMRVHTEWWFGSLARFFMLDTRQYRDPEPCPDIRASFLRGLDPRQCPTLHDPAHSMLGRQQRQWLSSRLPANPEVPWTILGNQTLMQPAVINFRGGPKVFTDGWDGYFGERRELLNLLGRNEVRNPVVLSGDVHAFYVNALRRDDDRADSGIVASEFVCGAITSPVPSARFVARVQKEHPAVRFTHTDKRGYVRLDIDKDRLRASLIGMSTIRQRQATAITLATFEVANGEPGPVRLD